MSSFLEIQDVIFRGTLAGAHGVAAFKLTVDAVDAVDSVNIRGDAVVAEYRASFSGSYAANTVVSWLSVVVPDRYSFVECLIIDTGRQGGWGLRWAGVELQTYTGVNPQFEHVPRFVAARGLATPTSSGGVFSAEALNGGAHQVRSGYFVVRVVRNTGSGA